jgi:hypothetical protein
MILSEAMKVENILRQLLDDFLPPIPVKIMVVPRSSNNEHARCFIIKYGKDDFRCLFEIYLNEIPLSEIVTCEELAAHEFRHLLQYLHGTQFFSSLWRHCLRLLKAGLSLASLRAFRRSLAQKDPLERDAHFVSTLVATRCLSLQDGLAL